MDDKLDTSPLKWIIGGCFSIILLYSISTTHFPKKTGINNTAPLSKGQVTQLLDQASPGNYQIDKILPQPVLGMTGVVLKGSSNQRFIAWVPPSGDALIVGALFDAKGQNQTITAMQTNDLEPGTPSVQPEPVTKGELIDSVAKADGITQGKGGLIVHAFIDMNCQFCDQLYSQLAPLVSSGQVTVHWIPVAILDASSADLAAALLQAPADQAGKLLERHHRSRENGTPIGGLIGVTPDHKSKISLAANTELLRVVNGAPATPVLMFRAKNGKVYSHAGPLQKATDLFTAGS